MRRTQAPVEFPPRPSLPRHRRLGHLIDGEKPHISAPRMPSGKR